MDSSPITVNDVIKTHFEYSDALNYQVKLLTDFSRKKQTAE